LLLAAPTHLSEYRTTCAVCLTLPIPGHNTHDGNPILGVCMRNFQDGRLVTSGNEPLAVSAIGHGQRSVGPYGRDPGRSQMTATRCVLTGTTAAALTGAATDARTRSLTAVLTEVATAVLTGAAAGAPSGRATHMNGTAATLAVPAAARGPPRRANQAHRSYLIGAQWPWPGSRRHPRQNRRADGCTHRPDLPRKPFRCTEREDVESQYFTSETLSLVASPNRSGWHPCGETDP
jgi:hypothetical protein